MLKFGLDWSWVDLNYSKYTISESEEPGSGSVGDIMDETIDIGNHQLEYGMQVGPSITINPVHELKISLYFRLTPSYSMMYLDDSFNSNFALFYSFGGTWNCKCLFSGTGHGADQGRDWILHGTKQRLGGKNGIGDQGSETHATALFINNC